MFVVWLVENDRIPEEKLSSLIAGNFPARLIASPHSLLHLLAISEEDCLPDVLVFNDGSVRNPMEIMGYFHALKQYTGRISVFIASSSSEHWLKLANTHFKCVELNNLNESVVVATIKNFKNQKLARNDIASPSATQGAMIKIGDLLFDRHNGNVTTYGQVPEELSPKESKILDTLSSNSNLCVSRSDLAAAVWPGIAVSQRTLDSHMSRLRKKINLSTECSIEAIYGEGYRLRIGA